MILHGYNETSSQPVNDLRGVPAARDSFGKASALWGYVAAKLTAACKCAHIPGDEINAVDKNHSASARRTSVRLALAFQGSNDICKMKIGIEKMDQRN